MRHQTAPGHPTVTLVASVMTRRRRRRVGVTSAGWTGTVADSVSMVTRCPLVVITVSARRAGSVLSVMSSVLIMDLSLVQLVCAMSGGGEQCVTSRDAQVITQYKIYLNSSLIYQVLMHLSSHFSFIKC